MKILIASCLISASACLAGNVPGSVIEKPQSLEDLEFGWPEEFEEAEFNDSMIKAARDFNDCLKISCEKNDRDHDRCDRNGGGQTCHDKADKKFEDNRNSCERIGHSDNVKDTISNSSRSSQKRPHDKLHTLDKRLFGDERKDR